MLGLEAGTTTALLNVLYFEISFCSTGTPTQNQGKVVKHDSLNTRRYVFSVYFSEARGPTVGQPTLADLPLWVLKQNLDKEGETGTGTWGTKQLLRSLKPSSIKLSGCVGNLEYNLNLNPFLEPCLLDDSLFKKSFFFFIKWEIKFHCINFLKDKICHHVQFEIYVPDNAILGKSHSYNPNNDLSYITRIKTSCQIWILCMA